ncbi:hypothetical protein KBT16_03110 [Nostoc sp. CCCryo 231-06]|nr:hypothetical protein [Nostoc sp. CCCryo 231-06]
MIQVIQAQNLTIAYLKEKFALYKSEDEQFFTEWFDYIPKISELEKQSLDRVKTIRNSQFAMTLSTRR